ncbi:FAD-dependent oxidoreductase [Pseudovibrio exalbescens]|uniref:NAD(P)/FAD-dependent oxidoreductase n=1 Tax=Pseudovibrio exalbescens TaxID=197461 RepID=UPI002364FD57|nr:FAD-dependent oxidoreductase [Pseudovibrio exalbescens]MDD7909314.1 FAD-dependent oxidoreductase [Pseudovibrio exalbescens]
MTEKIVVVGAGQAGSQVVQTLRQKGFEGDLVLIGDEPHLPYQRPPLSKKFLKGDVGEETLYLRPKEFYEVNKVELISGDPVVAVDRQKKLLELKSGSSVSYSKLVLTTGTKARALPIEGAQLDGVLSLRGIADVEALRPLVAPGKKVVIIGGGYIGLEVGAVAKDLGLDVRIVELQERLLKRVVSDDVARFFHELHEEKGVAFHYGVGVERIEGDGRAEAVVLSDGTRLECDFVLSAVGAMPNDALAEAAGLETDDGIIVDGHGQSSDEDVWACGDCVRFFSQRYGRSIRLESVQNAIDQAKTVAASLMNEAPDYDPLPWFWSDQYDIKLQIAGLSHGYEEAITVGSPKTGSFYVAYLKDGKLVCVDSINHPRSHMMARRVMGQDWHEDLLPPA